MREKRKEVRIKITWILILAVFFQTAFPVEISATSLDESRVTEEIALEESISDETVTSLDGVTVGGYFPEKLDAELVGEGSLEEMMVGSEATSPQYDPRESKQDASDNVLTSVKSQGNFGVCWAFGAIAASEASYNKNAGIRGTSALSNVDFSERHLAYFTYNNSTDRADPLGLTQGDSNLFYINSTRATADQYYNYGGNAEIAMMTMANGIGPQSESVVPYAASGSTTMSGVDDTYKYQSGIQLNNSRVIDMRQHDLVKQMIIDYGAVETSYYHPLDYYNYYKKTAEYASFHYAYDGTNHAIAVVGWDDTFSKDNFVNKPSTDGAWLVKNSWGTNQSFLDQGYFWMSYETTDYEIYGEGRNGYAFDVSKVDNSNRIYEYDGSIYPATVSVYSGGSIANVYQAEGATGENQIEVLNRVIIGLNSTDVGYSVQIYKNPTSTGYPASGTALLSSPVMGTTAASGFYEIPLKRNIILEKDDVFSVVVTLTKPQSWIGYYVATTKKYSYSSTDYIDCINDNKTGQSFYRSSSSSSWTDFKSNSGTSSATARIKACTELLTMTPVTSVSMDATMEIMTGETAALSATIEPADATDKELTWSSSDAAIASVDEDGNVTGNAQGTCTITATSSNGKTASCQVTVVKATALITFDSMSGNTVSAQSYYQGETYGTLPETQRRGYTFAGWYLDQECTTGNRVTDSTVVLASKSYTLYAKWSPLILNVSFEENGGVSISDRSYTYGEKLGTLPIPYRYGYTFTGWYLQESYSDNSLVSAENKVDLIENFTLFAGWEKEKATELLLEGDFVEMNVLSTHALKVATKPVNGDYESLTFSSDHEEIVSVNSTGLLTAKRAGTATVTVNLKVEEGTEFTKTCSIIVKGYAGIIAVTDQNQAVVGTQVNNKSISVNAYYAKGDGKFYPVSSDEIAITPDTISANGVNLITVTYSAENLSTTVTIEGVSTQEGQNNAPALLESSLTINKSKSLEGSISIRPAYGMADVTKIDDSLYRKKLLSQYSKESGFTVSKNGNNQYSISVNNLVKSGNYKLYSKAVVNQKEYYLPISITVVDKVPKLKVTSTKMNAFYTDQDSMSSALTITGKEATGEDVQIDHIVLDSTMNEWYTVSFDSGLGKYSLQLMKSKVNDSTIPSMIPQTGTVFVYLDGYAKSIPVGIKVKVEMKAPKMTLSEKSGIINVYQQSANEKVLTAYVNGEEAALSTVSVDNITSSYLNNITLGVDGQFVLNMKETAKNYFAKAKNITLTCYSSEWNKGVTVTYKLQIVNRIPMMKLTAKTVTFNRSYENSYAETKITGDATGVPGAYVLTGNMVECTSKNKGYAPKVGVSTLSDQVFRLRLYNGAQVQKGTYQYVITPELEDGTRLNKISFQVRVTENSGEAVTIFKAINNSKVDLLIGEDAYALYRMTLKNIEGTITDVESGDESSFETELVEQNGESLLKLSIAKGETVSSISYQVPVTLTVIDNNFIKQTLSSVIKVKPVESSLKLSFAGIEQYFYQNIGGSDNVMEIRASVVKPENATISSITCTTNSKEGAFEMVSLPQYGITRILLKDNTKVKSGDKITFTLKYKAGYGKKVITKKVKVVMK